MPKRRAVMEQYPGAVFDIGQSGGPTTVTFPQQEGLHLPDCRGGGKSRKRDAGIK
jgi:hypothetical protein